MKANFIKLLCLSALVTIASCQTYPLSQAFIQERAKIFGQNYDWYLKIDASYFKVYSSLSNTVNCVFNTLKPIFIDLNATYNDFSQAGLSEDVAKNFTTFFTNANATADSVIRYSPMSSMMMFSSGLMMASDLALIANGFKMAISSPLMTIMNSFTSQMTPIPDACITKVLSAFIPLVQPHVDDILLKADKAVAEIPNLYANLTTYVQNAGTEMEALAKKIRDCAVSPSKNVCIDQINQQYFNCAAKQNGQPCPYDEAIMKPMSENLQPVAALMQIYPVSGAPTSIWSMDLSQQLESIRNSC